MSGCYFIRKHPSQAPRGLLGCKTETQAHPIYNPESFNRVSRPDAMPGALEDVSNCLAEGMQNIMKGVVKGDIVHGSVLGCLGLPCTRRVSRPLTPDIESRLNVFFSHIRSGSRDQVFDGNWWCNQVGMNGCSVNGLGPFLGPWDFRAK